MVKWSATELRSFPFSGGVGIYKRFLPIMRMFTSAHLGDPAAYLEPPELDLGNVAFIRTNTQVAPKPEQTTTSKT